MVRPMNEILNSYKDGHTNKEVALKSSFAQNYIGRLRAGNRCPSRESAIVLARVLEMTDRDKREFLVAAGHNPVDYWNETIELVASIMESDKIPPSQKEVYSSVLRVCSSSYLEKVNG